MPNTDNRKKCTLLLIQNDCETLKTIILNHRNSVFSMCLIPYMALFCRSIQEYLNIELVSPEVDAEICDIRNSIKLFGERFGKGKKRFLASDEKQNQELQDMLRFKFMKKWNIHYNLGIYFDENGHVVGDTQLIDDMLKMSGLSEDERAKKSFSLGCNLASVIGSISRGMEIKPPDIQIDASIPGFYYCDVNTNKTPFFNSSFEKEVNLFALHILGNLGFVKYNLEPMVTAQNPWLLRIKYIATYYSYCGLRVLERHLEQLKQEQSSKFVEAAKTVDQAGEHLFDSTFRNCMMHYDLVENGTFAISEACYDETKPLFGLVETCFNNATYESFTAEIDSLGEMIEKLLVSQFNFKTLQIKKL